MPQIGLNTVGTNTRELTSARGSTVAAHFYTAVAGDVVDQIFFWAAQNSVPGAEANVAVYTVTSGQPDVRVNAPITVPVTSNTAQWWSTASGLGISLSAGVTYCIAFNALFLILINYDIVASGLSSNSSNALTATWNHFSFDNRENSLYAEVISSGGGGSAPAPMLIEDYDSLNNN